MMRNAIQILTRGMLLGLLLLASTGAAIAENIIYPSDLIYHPSSNPNGLVIDVTKNIPESTLKADPTGNGDSTAALIAAYDYVVKNAKNAKWGGVGDESAMTIYLPNGTYKVSNTIIYSGPDLQCAPNNCSGEEIIRLRFRGQSQSGTVIQLVNNASGFSSSSAPKEVVSFGRATRANAVASNFFENITINTGSGNAGAIGLKFNGANNGAVRNVTIKSGDANKIGSIGLNIPNSPQGGCFKNITVEGFNLGINVGRDASEAQSMSFEFITLTAQKTAGIKVVGGGSGGAGPSFRKVTSSNSVPALQITGATSQAVIIESNLSGGSSSNTAIDSQAGTLYARNITTSGYSSAIKRGTAVLRQGPNVDQYPSTTAEGVKTLFSGQDTRSLNLPIEETPHIPWSTDLTQWESVNSHGAVGNGTTDDTNAIQAAMNSGKPVIYFKSGKYKITDTITIPATVKRINFMFVGFDPNMSGTGTGVFQIEENSSDPLLVEDMFQGTDDGSHYIFVHNSTRTLVMEDIHAQRASMYRNTVQGGKVFIENVSDVDGSGYEYPDYEGTPGNCFTFIGQKVWARWINPERAEPEILNDNSTMWVLGFKTEGSGPKFEIKNGGKSEILGGAVNNYSPLIPATDSIIINNNSHVSFVGHTSGRDTCDPDCHYYRTMAKETRGGSTQTLEWAEVPRRGSGNQSFIPLYVGYTCSDCPYSDAPSAPTVAITAPTNGASFAFHSDITITVQSSDSDGTVSKVGFFVNGTKVGESSSAPYSFVWTDVDPGTYSLTAVATDNTGLTSTSEPVNVTVRDNPPTVTLSARNTTAPVTVDGTLSDAAWTSNVVTPVAKTISGTPNNTVTYGVVWDATYLYVGVRVLDSSLKNDSTNVYDDDSVEVYIDGNHNKATVYDSFDRQYIKGYNDSTVFEKNGRTTGVLHAVASISGGYTVEMAIPWTNIGITPSAELAIGFDVANNDDDDGAARDSIKVWSGTAANHRSTIDFGDVVLSGEQAPAVLAKRVSAEGVSVDGNLSEGAWATSLSTNVVKTISGTPNNTVTYGVMWDANYLYVAAKVLDSSLKNDSTNVYDDDSVEIYIDGNHNRGTTYDTFDRQFIKGYNDSTVFEKYSRISGVLHGAVGISGGYTVEIAIPWSNLGITPAAGMVIGFDVANNDDDNGAARDSIRMWTGTGTNYTDTSAFGHLYLSDQMVP